MYMPRSKLVVEGAKIYNEYINTARSAIQIRLIISLWEAVKVTKEVITKLSSINIEKLLDE